jgi:hypothetical protein
VKGFCLKNVVPGSFSIKKEELLAVLVVILCIPAGW